jgi:hypothetical protein
MLLGRLVGVLKKSSDGLETKQTSILTNDRSCWRLSALLVVELILKTDCRGYEAEWRSTIIGQKVVSTYSR